MENNNSKEFSNNYYVIYKDIANLRILTDTQLTLLDQLSDEEKIQLIKTYNAIITLLHDTKVI